MSGILVVVLVFFILAGALGAVAYFTYQKKLRRAKAIERGLKMVPILIHLPPPSSDTQGGSRDLREVMREKTSQAEVLYNLIAGTATEGFKSNFYGQRHIALELIVVDGLVHFYAAVPVALVSVVKKAIMTAYPGSRMEEVEDHNIFNQEGRLAATLGGEMVLRADSGYPIATYEQLERDPMEALLTTVAALEKQDGVAIQIMLRPAGPAWIKRAVALADGLRKGKHAGGNFSPMDLAKAAMKAPGEQREEARMKNGGSPDVSHLQLSQVERIEEKTKHPGFEVLVRVIVSTGSTVRSQQLLRDISTTFALYESPGLNGFKFLPALDVQGLVTAFIFRFFPNELSSNVLNSAELATLFHLPDSQFTPSTSVARQQSKQVDGPVQLPAVGLLFGFNEYRGVKKEIRLSPEDRRRHTYILGQTGTGKSTMLENLAVQDMLAGNGFAFIDPHGDSAEKLLALVPKERAEDVIYFNPADTQSPLGLNLFEFTDPAQKDFLVQETINMLYKLYDPGHTGIIGPRYEHWYRNAALTLMADPGGSTFIEIPKVFTDTDYLKQKFKFLKDPTVIDFWTKEMGQTSDYHKSEMLGWFVSKFGAFQNNEMMRNIIGQTKSSFNIREVMDQKKILIVNLSKGRIGELNSQLLGMIFVIKFQAAAMSRADVPENERTDFALYVDEFQNFSTDSFASILSEARKYRLNLIVANQFIGQLSKEIRDAVFGNIGTIVAHRMGPDDAEFMVKQYAPVFDASDLVNIPNYQSAMRLMIGGLPSQPFSIADSAPLGQPNAELGLAIKQLSAAKYGHDKAVVEADLLDRMTAKTPATAAPTAAPVPAAVTPVAPLPAQPVVPGVPAASPASTAESALMGGVPAAVDPLPSLALATTPEPVVAAMPTGTGQSTAVLAATPPPIGAPPMNANDEIGRQLAAATQSPPSVVAEPQAAVNREPLIPNGIVAPPPIGAPPIDLPAGQASVPAGSAPGTLSLMDITGGKAQSSSAPEPTDRVLPVATPAWQQGSGDGQPSQNDPYAGIDILGQAPPEPEVEAAGSMGPAQTAEPEVGDGRALPDDPYGQIDVLGEAPAGYDPTAAAQPVPTVEAGPVVGDGQALPDDPYAELDILGAASDQAVQPARDVAAPVPRREQNLPAEPELKSVPEIEPEPEIVPDPEPAYEAVPKPEPENEAPGPAAQAVPMPEPAYEIERVETQTEPEPAPRLSPAVLSPRETVQVALAQPERSWPVAPVREAPALVPAARPEPDWSNEPEPTQTEAPEPARPKPLNRAEPEEPTVSESFIHFVDPAAEALLHSPEPVAEVAMVDGKPSLSGLPEGIALVEPDINKTALPEPLPVEAAAPIQPAVTPTTAPTQPEAAPMANLDMLVSVADSLPEAMVPHEPPPAEVAPVAQVPAPVAVAAPPAAAPIVAPPPIEAPIAPAPIEASAAPPTSEAPTAPAPMIAQAAVPAIQAQLEPVIAEAAPVAPSAPPEASSAAAPKAPSAGPVAPEAVPEVPSVAPVVSPILSETIVPSPTLEAVLMAKPEATEPTQPIISDESKPVLTNAEQIQKAEHEIDDLLSVSLIRSDNGPTHRRLSEPASPPSSEENGPGLSFEMSSSDSKPAEAEKPAGSHPAVHHGLKVIQPLEPIVPPKEKFAAELAALQAESGRKDGTADNVSAQTISAKSTPAVEVKAAAATEAHHDVPTAVEPVAVASMPLAVPTPPVAVVPPAPAQTIAPAPVPALASQNVSPPVPAPALPVQPATPLAAASVLSAPELARPAATLAPEVKTPIAPAATAFSATASRPEAELYAAPTPAVPDVELPQAQSLAATDVAKVRAEQASAPTQVPPAPALIPKPPVTQPQPAAQVNNIEQKKPEELPKQVQKERAPETSNNATQQAPRKRHRRGRGPEKPAEVITSRAEAEHNTPTAAAIESAPLTGKLIMPTGVKPAREPEKFDTQKPKKLAPGEIFVDASGNVMIGE